MKAASTISALILLATSSTAWSQCDLLTDIPNPVSGDMTVTLTGDVECDMVDTDTNEMEDIVIDGGTVTITGESTTKFSNVRFQVEDGATLVFDFAMTNFGPNTGYQTEDDYGGYMLEVLDGGSVVFNGELYATDLRNMRSVFYIEEGGSMEVKGSAEFNYSRTNVFRSNYGTLSFGGDATFIDNIYLALENDGGTVRIAGKSYFEGTGGGFDGADGAAACNLNGGTFIFNGDAVFTENKSEETGGAVYNDGTMRFNGKADFYDNRSYNSDGGGLAHVGGDLKFMKEVQFLRNQAGDTGGGFSMRGDSTASFCKKVTFTDNLVSENGGAMSFLDWTSDGDTLSPSCEFSSKVVVSDNTVNDPDDDDACTIAYIEGNAGITGYEAPCN